MGDGFSFVAGMVLIFVSVLVMRAYWPLKHLDSGPRLLSWAIFIAFFMAATNAAYWQVAVKLLDWAGYDRALLREIGNYLDFGFKGGAAWAGWLHLKSIHENIEDPQERASWHVLEMPWYPDRRKCLRMLSEALRRRK